jgi:hypothetical protein
MKRMTLKSLIQKMKTRPKKIKILKRKQNPKRKKIPKMELMKTKLKKKKIPKWSTPKMKKRRRTLKAKKSPLFRTQLLLFAKILGFFQSGASLSLRPQSRLILTFGVTATIRKAGRKPSWQTLWTVWSHSR